MIVKGEPVILKKTGEVKMIENKVLRLIEEFDGDYDVDHYLKRVYDTAMILENLLDKTKIIDYHTVKGKKILKTLDFYKEE